MVPGSAPPHPLERLKKSDGFSNFDEEVAMPWFRLSPRRPKGPAVAPSPGGPADPLAHPALAAMSPHQLADLPLPRPEPRAVQDNTPPAIEGRSRVV
jgi:hypothetical protein